ncbi:MULTISPECIES: PAM68 family protein [Calothrix]|uniref:PAM68 family protein n=2 Tax=Calothrix TaxID=1186 RepID=A0ABR8A767_9CYAN|nr:MULTISPECIES: PAM68 family protein [Calothrix]MBD2195842.1 PAM68 family protein [Calothrix parietina FACHB-288]MBD2226409.1 PAM68 family protein [Calothrix anomala FACHB-343]
MSAEESERSRLPFEPNTKRQKPAKAKSQPPAQSKESGEKTTKTTKQPPYTKEEMAIPKVVSQRMIRRVAAFCGIPTALGIATLVASYILTIYTDIRLAPIAVLLVNMALFGLGVLGITYGVLSASWDEDRVGSWLGAAEFGTNWGRMVDVWRETRQKKV